MGELEAVLRAVGETNVKLGALDATLTAAKNSIIGVHSRIDRVEMTVTELAKTSGKFQLEAVQRLKGVESGLNNTKGVAVEAKCEARRAGQKAGGLLGTIASAIVIGLWKLIGSLWGKP